MTGEEGLWRVQKDSLCVGVAGPPTLQVKMCCQREAEQCSGASLHFSLNGRTALLLDTMSITWTVIDPGATGIKEEWENNQELAKYFRTISTGDCSYWLREFLKHWENMLLQRPQVPERGVGEVAALFKGLEPSCVDVSTYVCAIENVVDGWSD